MVQALESGEALLWVKAHNIHRYGKDAGYRTTASYLSLSMFLTASTHKDFFVFFFKKIIFCLFQLVICVYEKLLSNTNIQKPDCTLQKGPSPFVYTLISKILNAYLLMYRVTQRSEPKFNHSSSPKCNTSPNQTPKS